MRFLHPISLQISIVLCKYSSTGFAMFGESTLSDLYLDEQISTPIDTNSDADYNLLYRS